LNPGVPDQIYPPGTEAYALLQSGDCDALMGGILGDGNTAWADADSPPVPLGLRQLYTAAARACRRELDLAKAAVAEADTRCDLKDDGSDLEITASSYLAFRPDMGNRTPQERKTMCEDHRNEVFRWTNEVVAALEADPSYVPVPSGSGG
jgi:hypothetical protein